MMKDRQNLISTNRQSIVDQEQSKNLCTPHTECMQSRKNDALNTLFSLRSAAAIRSALSFKDIPIERSMGIYVSIKSDNLDIELLDKSNTTGDKLEYNDKIDSFTLHLIVPAFIEEDYEVHTKKQVFSYISKTVMQHIHNEYKFKPETITRPEFKLFVNLAILKQLITYINTVKYMLDESNKQLDPLPEETMRIYDSKPYPIDQLRSLINQSIKNIMQGGFADSEYDASIINLCDSYINNLIELDESDSAANESLIKWSQECEMDITRMMQDLAHTLDINIDNTNGAAEKIKHYDRIILPTRTTFLASMSNKELDDNWKDEAKTAELNLTFNLLKDMHSILKLACTKYEAILQRINNDQAKTTVWGIFKSRVQSFDVFNSITHIGLFPIAITPMFITSIIDRINVIPDENMEMRKKQIIELLSKTRDKIVLINNKLRLLNQESA